ncbi:MAG: hypothetical protein ACPGED_06530 [Flavobacteriales bacterium]
MKAFFGISLNLLLSWAIGAALQVHWDSVQVYLLPLIVGVVCGASPVLAERKSWDYGIKIWSYVTFGFMMATIPILCSFYGLIPMLQPLFDYISWAFESAWDISYNYVAEYISSWF